MNAGFVRPARSHDADAIVSVALAAWRNLPWLSLDEDSNVVDAVRADWQSLLGRTTSQAPATSTAPADADSASAIAPVPDAAVLVATQSDDVLVGWLLLGAPEDGFPGGVCEVLDVVVAPSSQRQGHGSRLMHAAADTARERGVAWLSAWCPLPDEARRAFLLAHGFAPDGAVRDLLGGDAPDQQPGATSRNT